jgi:TolB-like protein/class 3 adenylate cyclase/tetratricopeptide (TPR) repeat protein
MGTQRVERRLSAVLAADIAGYSRLVGIDEEGTLAALRTLRLELIDPSVAAHGGRIVKTTGDGILAEFPSVVDAGRCAVEIQRGTAERTAGDPPDRRIAFRIGIHLGDVVVDGEDVLGDSVNIAARLEGIAEPGSINLSEDAWRQVRDKLPERFDDLGEQTLKNIARPVRVYRLDLAGGGATRLPTLALPDKPSIAVLPFQNLSGDPEQEYFSDGMVEDIITGLSRIKWLFVIARNSSFAYKGRALDIKQVGRELGVRYVLEGSVRKAGNRLRITGQLIEAETGTHVWADRYDGVLEDVFDLQDRMTETIVAIIEPSVRGAEIERARRKRPDNLGAYDLFLRALPHAYAAMPDDAAIAIRHLEEALKLDPDYAAAHAVMAVCYEARYRGGDLAEADRTAGIRHARLALALGTDDAASLAYAALTVLHLAGDFEAAASAIARAQSLNASCATALYWGAHVHAWSGDTVLAEDCANRALRLSPFDPLSYEGHVALGAVRMREGRYQDAAAQFAKAAQENPRFSAMYALHAAALALAGRVEDAKAVARRLREVDPTFRLGPFQEFATKFVEKRLYESLSAGFHQAGLPE